MATDKKMRISRRSLFGLATSMTVLAPGCGPNAPIVAGTDARAATTQTSSGAGTLHTFTLHNTSGSTSTGAMVRLGLAFTKGDVPAGKRLAVRVKGGSAV